VGQTASKAAVVSGRGKYWKSGKNARLSLRTARSGQSVAIFIR
jgi:hypothetical protein